MITNNGQTAGLLGLSTDTKPTEAQINDLFFELDTRVLYYFDGTEWKEVGE